MTATSGSSERREIPRGLVFGEPAREELAATILGNYREMPGLCLRVEQAARLFGLRLRTCEAVLSDLVRTGRLRRAPDGQYVLPVR